MKGDQCSYKACQYSDGWRCETSSTCFLLSCESQRSRDWTWVQSVKTVEKLSGGLGERNTGKPTELYQHIVFEDPKIDKGQKEELNPSAETLWDWGGVLARLHAHWNSSRLSPTFCLCKMFSSTTGQKMHKLSGYCWWEKKIPTQGPLVCLFRGTSWSESSLWGYVMQGEMELMKSSAQWIPSQDFFLKSNYLMRQ